jgi:hypothetical protein
VRTEHLLAEQAESIYRKMGEPGSN